ncbi:hypothetical protein B0H13DRAFT_2291060 [Mycena leptocephala]|nr:hypothetical protein B0H13DRAFT_2291060 [Mycena leptocephala]
MQDNLEFLQWLKRFWDANFAGGEYDAVGRRKGAPSDPPATLAPIHPSSSHAASSARAGGRTPVSGHRSTTPGGRRLGGQELDRRHEQEVAALTGQVRELTGQLEGLEKERDFYFEKLRDIEILAQQKTEALEAAGAAEDETLKEIQKILYSTEEGFEVPDGEGGGVPLDRWTRRRRFRLVLVLRSAALRPPACFPFALLLFPMTTPHSYIHSPTFPTYLQALHTSYPHSPYALSLRHIHIPIEYRTCLFPSLLSVFFSVPSLAAIHIRPSTSNSN